MEYPITYTTVVKPVFTVMDGVTEPDETQKVVKLDFGELV